MIYLQNIIKITFFISRALEFLALFIEADNRDLQEAGADQEQHLGNDSNDSNDRSQESGQGQQ